MRLPFNFLLIKGKVDFILAIVMFIILLPFIFLAALILTILLKSSPFIMQARGITGEHKIFKIFKFKTIIIDKTNVNINGGNILYKPHLAEYIPAFCGWLRKSGLDELPQIINVLKGEMSFIGPRPLMISDVELLRLNYPELYRDRQSIKVKPGITGLWQVYGDRNKGIKNLVALDLEYNERACLWLDLKIIAATVLLVLSGKHSDAIIQGITGNRKIKRQVC